VTTRADFFARVRAEMRKAPPPAGPTPPARPTPPAALADAIRRELSARWPETAARFRREFERVGGNFHRAATAAGAGAVVADLARAAGARSAVSWQTPALGADLGPDLAAAGVTTHVMPPGPIDDAAERARLRATIAAADLGLTGADLAIAETGTLVLVSGPGRPRSTSLLPPVHVALLAPAALVETLGQAGVFLEAWHDGAGLPWRGGAINFITGPSRTADIELTLTRGVHGPREVHAVLVEQPARG
jgi:L-lactate dehydrogenase complex protein LldG